jgi:hypothetical protein
MEPYYSISCSENPLLEIILRHEWFHNGERLKLTVEYMQSCEEFGVVPRREVFHQIG